MQAKSRGDPLPKFLADAPLPLPETEILIGDWIALSSCRAYSQAGTPLAIPWTAVDAYAARRGINGTAFDEFEAAIAACEMIYGEHIKKVCV